VTFPLEFWGFLNIFQRESGYFPQNLQLKILAGGGCVKSRKLFDAMYVGDLDTV
jgi:hypothetical protein